MINWEAVLHIEKSWKHSAGSSMGDSSCRAPENLLSTVTISPLLRFMVLGGLYELCG